MKFITGIVIFGCMLWLIQANPVGTLDVNLNCTVDHSEGVTWQQHCDYLNRDCLESATPGEPPSCGNCTTNHVEDKINKDKCIAANSCNETHSSGVGTWQEQCDSVHRKCVPSTSNSSASCGQCFDQYVDDQGFPERCVGNFTCDGTHKTEHNSWQEFCDAKNKVCNPPATLTDEPSCGGCIPDYIPGTNPNECVVKKTCDNSAHPSGEAWTDFCNSKKRECQPPSGNDVTDWCRGCIANHVVDKVDKSKCVAQDSCEGSHPHAGISWQDYCDSKNRTCSKSSGAVDARCGDCLPNHRPSVHDLEQCVEAALDCEGAQSEGVTWQEHCDHLKRDCIAPTSTNDQAKCGNCKAGHVEDTVNKDKCVAQDTCDVTHSSGVGTWKEYCDGLKRKCEPPTANSNAKCEGCLDGYEEDRVRNETCVAKNSCNGTHPSGSLTWEKHCLANKRVCTPSTSTEEARCGECLPGHQEDQDDKEKCTAKASCEGPHPSGGTWNKFCEDRKRSCVASNDTSGTAECGDCLDDHVPDESDPDTCVPMIESSTPDSETTTTSVEPTTVKPKVCPAFTLPANADYMDKNNCKEINVDDICKIKCKDGFRFKTGNGDVKCEDDGDKGKWPATKPECSTGTAAVASLCLTLILTLAGLISGV